MMDNELRQEDGSYIFRNITAADSAYASGDGIEYYCTATNDFGTIRSRTVRAFYAGERERRDRETGWGAISGSWNVPITAKVPSTSAFDWQGRPCVLVSSTPLLDRFLLAYV